MSEPMLPVPTNEERAASYRAIQKLHPANRFRLMGGLPLLPEDPPAKRAMTLDEMLESRHETRLEWHEPWEACGPEGNPLDAHVTMSCTVHDAINMARAAAKKAGHPTMGQDAEFLSDFISLHFASVVTK